MQCEDYCEAETDNEFFAGYTLHVEVTNLLVFKFFGEVNFCGCQIYREME